MTIQTRRAMSVRRLIIISGVGVVVLVGLGAAIAAGRAQPKSDKNAQRQTSDLVEAVRGDFDISTTASGELRARNQIEIRNTIESETTIVEIIPEGASVKAGDLLARVNAEPIQTRLDEESLALESAKSAMVEAEQSYQIQISENDSAKRQAELKVALALLDLDQWKQGEVESKRQELDHAMDRTEKDQQRLADKLEKSKGLEKKGYYSLDQLRQDELALEQAVAALEKARLDKQVYWSFQHPKDKRKRESDLEEARAELDRVLRQNESRMASKEADRNNKRQAVTIREQKFNKLREQLAAATIKAPSDGLVVYAGSLDMGGRWGGDEGPLQVGKKVYPNELLIVLPDTSEMIASVKVHESLAGRLRPGLIATVKIDAAGERRFTGRIDTIGILAEQSSRWMDPTLREYTVKIALDIPPSTDAKGAPTAHGLKPSMRCEAEIFLGKVTDAVTIPIQAVFSDGLVRYVHQPEGSRFVKRPVLIGQRSDRFVEVKAGVQPGQRVLIRKPEPAEVISNPWNETELAAVGLKVNDQGTIVPAGGSGVGGGAGSEPTAAIPVAPALAPKPSGT